MTFIANQVEPNISREELLTRLDEVKPLFKLHHIIDHKVVFKAELGFLVEDQSAVYVVYCGIPFDDSLFDRNSQISDLTMRTVKDRPVTFIFEYYR